MSRGAVVAVVLGALAALGLVGATLTDDGGADAVASVTGGMLGGSSGDGRSIAEQDTDVAPTEAPPFLGPVPELVPVDGWLQTDAATFDDFDGTVRIVQFWTFSCFNCTNTIPYLQAIYADARPRGLEIIGVHSPEFEREEDPAAVARAAQDLGVTWPIALDTDKALFRSWQGSRRFWPRTYVIDQNGQIRFDHVGEGAYDELTATVDWLLANGPGEPPLVPSPTDEGGAAG